MEFIPMKQFVAEYVGEIITSDEVIQGYDVCLKYKKPVPRPVDDFAWATDSNQTVGMDLKELGQSLWFCILLVNSHVLAMELLSGL